MYQGAVSPTYLRGGRGGGAYHHTTSVVVSYNKLGLPDYKYVCNKPESNFLQVEQSTLNFINIWGPG